MILLSNLRRVLVFLIFIATTNLSHADCKGYADIVEPLIPAVVSISVVYQEETPFDSSQILALQETSQAEDVAKFLERFEQSSEEDSPLKPSSSGSGFIISPDGYIVTNYHVIDKAEKIIVTLNNDQQFDAKLIAFDNRTDLALLKINSESDLSFVGFGNSDENRVGDSVIAIGNPFGLGNTVTTGIISAQARNIRTDSMNIVDNFIQTDAAINEGNSGGPIFNIKGEVIGINFFIVSPTGVNIGIGFAVPSSIAKPIIDQLLKDGKVHHGWIGIATQTPEDNIGSLVSSVAKGGPAEKAGIKIGDIILKFDGKTITNTKGLPRMVAETHPKKQVLLEIIRDGKTITMFLTVEEVETKH
ncbi:MAG: trypsin-like peptidase domain-containing protein [Rickettsiales bacterium]|jgi:serine protease Do|nr:trypsin-like peptidase domain-containing protein [Rickettsiales bacterium]